MTGLQVRGLRVTDRAGRAIVGPLDLHAAPGEVIALVGPSGAGKTLALTAILDALEPPLRRGAGTVTWNGVVITPGRPARRWRHACVGVVAQDPQQALHPLRRALSLVAESGAGPQRSRAALAAVGLDPAQYAARRAHQLSGGQAQRVAVARAVAAQPPLLVLDEPTSALDPHALGLVASAVRVRRGDPRCITLLVSHDTAFVAALADRAVHLGAPATAQPAAAPAAPTPLARRPLLTVRGLRLAQPPGGPPLLRDVHLRVDAGEFVAVRGPSGSGKSTLLRALAGLHPVQGGRADLAGTELPWPVRRRPGGALRAIQLVGQHPADALNPAHRVGAALARPLRTLGGPAAPDTIARMLTRVGLDPAVATRRPAGLSGGQRQRVALARALAPGPRLLLADEITAALDAATAAGMLDLLDRLRADGLAVLAATHDPAVAARADRVLRLRDNDIVPDPCGKDTAHAR